MIFAQAKKLHNGDEVISKETGESIRVLSIKVFEPRPKPLGVRPSVCIEGVGPKTGYHEWVHDEVR